MNPEIKARWVAALRSGAFQQGHYRLQRNGQFCCLGVLCEIAVQDGVVTTMQYSPGDSVFYCSGPTDDGFSQDSSTELPAAVITWAGLADIQYPPDPIVPNPLAPSTTVSLATLNDDGDYDFAAIADLIEEHL